MTVAARVHRLAPQAAVILISGRIDFVPPEALDRSGVAAFLRMPINLWQLRRLVSGRVNNPCLTRKELGSPLAWQFSLGR